MPINELTATQVRVLRATDPIRQVPGRNDATTGPADLATLLQELSQLGTARNAEGASMIGIEDAAGVFTGTTVEAALQELAGAGGVQVDLIFTAATELTIAAGAVVATQAIHTIDTEADAATDDLTTITGGTAEEHLLIRPNNAARTVRITHGIGANLIATPGGKPINLAEATDWALLYRSGTQWTVIAASTLDTPTELTIAVGSVAATGLPQHTIDTEADAATDDLTTITGGVVGQGLLIRPANAARTVRITHGIGANLIATPGAYAIELAEATDWAYLVHDGTQWAVLASSTLAEAMIRNVGRLSVGYVLITGGGTADGDQVGIGGRLYEFDTNAAIAGQVAVDVSGGANPAQSITALVGAINGDGAATVRAIDIGGDVCALFARTVAGGNPALTNPVDAGGTIDVSGATFTGSDASDDRSVRYGTYTVTAQDVTTMAPGGANGEIVVAAFASTQAPTLFAFQARDVNGVYKSVATLGARVVQSGANEWALVVQEGGVGAVLANTDVLTFAVGITA